MSRKLDGVAFAAEMGGRLKRGYVAMPKQYKVIQSKSVATKYIL